MNLNKIKMLLTQILCLQLAIGMGTGYAAPVVSTPQLAIAKNVDTRALENANPEYVKTLSEMLKALGAKKVVCTSGYRSPDEQRRACIRICGNPNGCPNLCAPPGRSQHQQTSIATCDLAGLTNGCYELKRLCDEKFNGKCGIGGYAGGGYHFGVNDTRFSAWNKCAGLPRNKGNYGPDFRAPADPSPGSATGTELIADEASKSHEIIIIAAIAALGVGGALLYQKMRNKK